MPTYCIELVLHLKLKIEQIMSQAHHPVASSNPFESPISTGQKPAEKSSQDANAELMLAQFSAGLGGMLLLFFGHLGCTLLVATASVTDGPQLLPAMSPIVWLAWFSLACAIATCGYVILSRQPFSVFTCNAVHLLPAGNRCLVDWMAIASCKRRWCYDPQFIFGTGRMPRFGKCDSIISVLKYDGKFFAFVSPLARWNSGRTGNGSFFVSESE